MEISYRLPQTIHLDRISKRFYNLSIGLYLLHMAVMADLTSFYPDVLMRFRVPSFILVSCLALLAIGSRVLRKQLPLRAILLYLILLSLMLAGFLHPENVPYIKEILFQGYFIKYVLLFSLLFLYEEDPDIRNRQLTVIAIASLLVYQLGISQDMFYDENGNFEYMTVGYGCAQWWVVLAQGVFYYRNKLIKLACFIGTVYFAAIIAVYGNRGALVLLFFTVALLMAIYIPLKHLTLLGIVILSALGGILLFLEPILLKVGNIFGLDLENSRNFILLTRGVLGRDSGRFPIYRECFGAILRHPLFGNGIGGDRVATELHGYAHNIVLELCVDFGVIIGLLIYGWLLYVGFQMLFRCHNRAWRALFLPFYTFSMIQLIFSGSLYRSGYLLASLVIYLTYVTYVKHNCIVTENS